MMTVLIFLVADAPCCLILKKGNDYQSSAIWLMLMQWKHHIWIERKIKIFMKSCCSEVKLCSLLCFFCLSLHHLQWRCHLIQFVKCGRTEGWFFKHLLPNSCVAGHTPLSTQQVLSEPDRLKNKQTSKSSTSYVMCVCVHTCVPLFLWPLPDVHLFDILHKRTSGERCERTHGHRVSVSHCFCWLNLHPSEGEVLGTRAYKAAICKISLRPKQLCNSLNLCVKNKITPSQRLL